MSDAVLVAVLSLSGTLIGSLAGIMTANKLATWRIEQLEKKVAEHNGIKDRTVILEQGQKTLFRLHDENRVLEERYEAEGTLVRAMVDDETFSRLVRALGPKAICESPEEQENEGRESQGSIV